MAEIALSIAVVMRRRADGLLLGEALLVPGTGRCSDHPGELKRLVVRAARERLAGLLDLRDDPSCLQTVQLAETPSVIWLTVEIPPLGRTPSWSALSLSLPMLRWRHGAHHRAYLPCLSLDMVVDQAARLEPACREQVLESLMRVGARQDLRRILALAQDQEITLAMVEISVPLREARDHEPDEDIQHLHQLCQAVPPQPATGVAALVERLAASLSARSPRSVLLVGPPGAGKSAVVRELARRAADHGLEQRPLLATSGSRLVAGMTGYGMWQERLVRLRRGAVRAGAILHLGALRELIEVGHSDHNQQGLAEFLRPWIASGELLCVLETTPEDLAALEAAYPTVIAAFERLVVPEADAAQARAVLTDWCHSRAVLIEEQALALVVSLHGRFASYSAAPGRPLSFLRDLQREHPRERLERAQVLASFTRATGIPRVLIDDRVPLDGTAASQWFSERILGQPAAVARVVDLLFQIKGGLARGDRPLASLLFAGPTGVGKTEMAKALAEYLYGDRGRMVRFDMSEFSSGHAVLRLIGQAGGGMGRLVAAVRREPFSVILLDEIEKAHPLAFDLLLQALGEGRLSDASGHTADLRSSVVIMTSNLGVAEGRRLGLGFTAVRDAAARASEAIAGHFRPEFINRIDSILVFAELGAEVALSLAERELRTIAGREGLLSANLALEWTPAVAARFAELDQDGARGLKRRIDRSLALPLADVLNRAQLNRRDGLAVREAGGAVSVGVVPRGTPGAVDETPVEAASTMRRQHHRLVCAPALRALTAERIRAEGLKHRKPTKHTAAALAAVDGARLRAIELLIEHVRGFGDEALRLEVEQLGRSLAGEAPVLDARGETLARRFDDLLLAVWRLEHPGLAAERVLLAFRSDEPAVLLQLAAAYAATMAQEHEELQVHQLEPQAKQGWTRRLLSGTWTQRQPPDGAILLLEVSGRASCLRWRAEAGLHGLERGKRVVGVSISVVPGVVSAWKPPAEGAGERSSGRFLRQWLESRRQVLEAGSARQWRCTESHRQALLAAAAADHVRRELDAVLGAEPGAEDGASGSRR